MKTITKERIVKTLKKIDALRLAEVEAGGEVIKAMANLGIESEVGTAFDKDLPALSIARMDLELIYLEQPKDPAKLKEVMVRWQADLEYRDRFREAVYGLQAKAGISGLARGSYRLGGEEFPCWTEADDLRLIEPDLEKLSDDVHDIFNHWKDCALGRRLKLWFFHKERLDWLPVRLTQVSRMAFDADWAIAMEAKDQEIQLILGKGLDRSSAECCLDFRASSSKPA